jgi:hypothetical protein
VLQLGTTQADVNAALEIRGRAQLRALRMSDAGAEPVTQQDAPKVFSTNAFSKLATPLGKLFRGSE